MAVDTVETGSALCERLLAMHEAYLPPEMQQGARMLVNQIVAVTTNGSTLELARLYRSLVEALPEQVRQVRAAFEATIFEGCLEGDEDWWQAFQR